MEMQHDLSKAQELFTQEGWEFMWLRLGETRWVSASKQFESAGGARTAVLYLRPTQEGGLFLHGTYQSAGEDVLAGHLLLVSAREAREIETFLPTYLEEANRRIENSWGRRVLRAA